MKANNEKTVVRHPKPNFISDINILKIKNIEIINGYKRNNQIGYSIYFHLVIYLVYLCLIIANALMYSEYFLFQAPIKCIFGFN